MGYSFFFNMESSLKYAFNNVPTIRWSDFVELSEMSSNFIPEFHCRILTIII